MAAAYANNPQLNAQRANVRAIDEGVPQALAGYRPRITATASVGEQFTNTTSKTSTTANVYSIQSGTMTPSTAGITATQTLYNGFQTANRTRQAESSVFAARETLLPNIRRFAIDYNLRWPNIISEPGEKDIAAAYGVTEIPATVLIGRDGNIAAIDLPRKNLEPTIAKLLGR